MKRIIVENLSKTFNLSHRKKKTFLSSLLSFISGKSAKKRFEVLKNISFEVEEGEILGVIGKNGSGKSTLLRIISGILPVFKGRVRVNGNITNMISLQSGINERMTMRETIFMLGSLYGLSQQEIKKRFDSIVRFTEIKEFLDTKLYQFSNGMKARLAFSIVIHTDFDILLIDEGFGGADLEFRKKAFNKIRERVDEGVISQWSHKKGL
jgi:ABC-type polysaccharide/polyol phosphate transport system ATPase subunit